MARRARDFLTQRFDEQCPVGRSGDDIELRETANLILDHFARERNTERPRHFGHQGMVVMVERQRRVASGVDIDVDAAHMALAFVDRRGNVPGGALEGAAEDPVLVDDPHVDGGRVGPGGRQDAENDLHHVGEADFGARPQ